jgi:hypothetical protein
MVCILDCLEAARLRPAIGIYHPNWFDAGIHASFHCFPKKWCVTIVPRHESSGESCVAGENAPGEQDVAITFVVLLSATGNPCARILTRMTATSRWNG